jgi:hypothetical protein
VANKTHPWDLAPASRQKALRTIKKSRSGSTATSVSARWSWTTPLPSLVIAAGSSENDRQSYPRPSLFFSALRMIAQPLLSVYTRWSSSKESVDSQNCLQRRIRRRFGVGETDKKRDGHDGSSLTQYMAIAATNISP